MRHDTRSHPHRPLRLLAGAILALATLAAPGFSGTAGAAPSDFSHDIVDVDFGTQVAGDSVSRDFTVTNTSAITRTPDFAGSGTSAPFGLTTAGCADLAPSDSCTVTVAVSSIPAGESTGSFFLWIDGDPAGTFDLRVFGEPGDITVSPVDHDFGDVIVGDTATLETVLSNETGADIPLSTAGGGVGGGDFSSYQNCAGRASLAPGESCQLTFEFTPTTSGEHTDSTSYTVNGDRHPISVRGVGISPFSVSPDVLDFGDVPVGDTETRSVTVTNDRSVDAMPDLTGTASDNPNFTIGEGTCLGLLAPGESCEGEVVFAPPAPGTDAGTLTVVTDGVDHNVIMTGRGVEPTPDTDPDSGDAGDSGDEPSDDPADDPGDDTGDEPESTTTTPGDEVTATSDGDPEELAYTGDKATAIGLLLAGVFVTLGAMALAIVHRYRTTH